MSNIVLSQTNQAIGYFGGGANATIHLQSGLGSWTTNAIQTTASIGFASISSSASQLRPYFQLIYQSTGVL